MSTFNQEFYDKVINDYNYEKTSDASFILKNIPKEELVHHWLCGYNIEVFNNVPVEKSLVSMGLGINNTPHLGTLNQILKIIKLQRAGYDVQVILGDMHANNARGRSTDKIKQLSEKYSNFITKLGFDTTKGRIRKQSQSKNVAFNAFQIANYVRNQDFKDLIENAHKQAYTNMSFPLKQAILMIIADTLSPGIDNEYKSILANFGIDEHVYVSKAHEIADRMGLDFTVSGLFSKPIKGINGHELMGKSKPNSGIFLDSDPVALENLIMKNKNDTSTMSDEKIFELMQNLSFDSDNKKDFLHSVIQYCQTWKTLAPEDEITK